ncbi:head GIN domain-containing protein [Pedobacter deserti]|uniref:head GIN domain-containing protein n=1 Tax=Pedobacter deserti TaxID=2817382 RepID=UPI00210A575A|nr:head GIN domain-containing protein [Pedobacter sp. SYSU D00382]
MKHLLLSAFIGLSLMSCTKDRLTANGERTSETRNLDEFTGVSANGATDVQISYGTEYRVVIKGSSNLIPHFETEVRGGILYLQYDDVNVRHDDLQVSVTLPLIDHVSASGSGEIDITGAFPAVDEFRVSVSGSGEVDLERTIEAENARVSVSGSGNADLEALRAEDADVEVSGSGEVEITVYNRLKARISGSGKIYYNGNPQVDAEVSGSGKVLKNRD